MAFSYTQNKGVFGNLKVRYGTFTNTSTSTGGAIATGLTKVETVVGAGISSASVSGGAVTITTGSGVDGYYEIKGY